MNILDFLKDNFLVILILGGLLICMYVYRDTKIPASNNFLLIILITIAMCIASTVELWACEDVSRYDIRMIASVVHYILQPFVIYLELIIIMPEKTSTNNKLLLGLPIIINTIVYLIAPFTNGIVFRFNENYNFNRGILGYTIYIVTFLYLLILLYWSLRFLSSDEHKKGMILLFAIGTGIITGILEFLNKITGFIDEAFAFGLFLYYTYLITIHESEMQNRLTKQELELAHDKITLLRQQIRPHFIFNSLHIIKSLIRTDKEKAIECLEDFSDYLRANIDTITSDQLIAFDDEITHIEAYVSLALADKSKNISVVYDIKEKDFRLPALSIEPLVENAIRHGIKDGGEVKLSTYNEDDKVVIVVSDNGKGFEIDGTDKEKKRLGTGIENVRSRLAEQCNGTLEINSSEHGTDVIVKIPR